MSPYGAYSTEDLVARVAHGLGNAEMRAEIERRVEAEREREANATDREVLLGTASSLRAAKWGVCTGELGRAIMAKLQARVTKIADELEARAERIES